MVNRRSCHLQTVGYNQQRSRGLTIRAGTNATRNEPYRSPAVSESTNAIAQTRDAHRPRCLHFTVAAPAAKALKIANHHLARHVTTDIAVPQIIKMSNKLPELR